MSKNAFQLSRWIEPVNVVISLSTWSLNEPAIGYSARLISSIRRSREPACAIIAEARAESPSLPFGSYAEPTVKSSFTFSCGSTVFWTRKFRVRRAGRRPSAANVASAGSVAMASGIGELESVARTRLASVK